MCPIVLCVSTVFMLWSVGENDSNSLARQGMLYMPFVTFVGVLPLLGCSAALVRLPTILNSMLFTSQGISSKFQSVSYIEAGVLIQV